MALKTEWLVGAVHLIIENLETVAASARELDIDIELVGQLDNAARELRRVSERMTRTTVAQD